MVGLLGGDNILEAAPNENWDLQVGNSPRRQTVFLALSTVLTARLLRQANGRRQMPCKPVFVNSVAGCSKGCKRDSQTSDSQDLPPPTRDSSTITLSKGERGRLHISVPFSPSDPYEVFAYKSLRH